MADGPETDDEKQPPQTPKEPPQTPKEPASEPTQQPQDVVMLSKAEHDRIQAENRRTKRELAKREERDQEAAQQREIQERAAKDDFDGALGVLRDENSGLKRELRRTRASDALRDEIERRGHAGSRASAIRRLAGQVKFDDDGYPDEESVQAAVDAVEKDYPDLFGEPPDEPEAEEAPEEDTRRRRRGAPPATPPTKAAMPEGFVSPEEYQRTPAQIRTTAEFQKRVERSKPFWPGYARSKSVSATSFAVDG